MVFAMNFMQKIIVHNKTKYELSNLVLKHTGAGASTSDAQTLKPFGEESIQLYTLRLIKDTDLVLSCEWNGEKIESVIYNKLSSNDLRNISIIIIEKDDKLKYTVLVDNDVKR